MTKKRQAGGFTLIELLVVIAIIGLLASIILASLNSARAKSRDARRVADLKDLQTALELYASDNNGAYPAALSSLSVAPNNDISTVPSDPGSYSYGYATLGSPATKYCITARLEGTAPPGSSTSCNNGVTTPAPNGSGGTVYAVNN